MEFIGLGFIVAVVGLMYLFIKPKIAIGCKDVEPTLDRAALDRKEISKMVIDIDEIKTIGR